MSAPEVMPIALRANTVDADPAPTPGVRDIGAALMRTLWESADSKKSMAGFVGAFAAILSLIAGKQGWTWLDPQTSQLIAAVIVGKALAVIAAHTVVDKAKATAQGPNAPLSQAPDATSAAVPSSGGGGAGGPLLVFGDKPKA